MKDQSELLSIFVSLLSGIKIQFGQNIKILRTDKLSFEVHMAFISVLLEIPHRLEITTFHSI